MSRQRKLLALVVLLMAANFWRMSSGHHPAQERAPAKEGISVADLTVNAAFTGSRSAGPMRRDVFQMRVREERPATTQRTTTSPVEPPKSAAQKEEEVARAELAKIRLLGVVVREGKAQAYLAQGADTYLAFEGDTVANRFVVESAAEDSVTLKDQILNIRGRIPISGR